MRLGLGLGLNRDRRRATPAPVAAFSGTPLTGAAPLSVVFTDASTNTPTSWLWEKNSGSGWVNFASTPTVQNPTEVFAEGTWDVRLTATNAGGSDGETKLDYVVSAWTPASLTNLELWFTAGPTWCFSDAGGTVACGAGDSVYVWKDRSGNALDVSQATSGRRPKLQQTSGKWCVRFAEADSTMLFRDEGVGGTTSTAHTVAFACKPADAAGNKLLCDLSSSYAIYTPQTPSSFYGWYDGSWIESAAASATGDQAIVFLPSAGKIRRDGLQIATGVSFTGGRNLNRIYVGNLQGGGSNHWSGDVYEMVIALQTVAGADLTSLETYLDGQMP